MAVSETTYSGLRTSPTQHSEIGSDDGEASPRPTIPTLLLPNPIKFVERASSSELARFGNASATTPGGLRARLERSWTGAAFAQECNAASPCPSASAGADSLIRFLVAGHTGVLIVEIDLTRIGLVSRTFPFESNPARSAPPRVAARRTAQTTAAEKTDRSRMEFALRIASIRLRSRQLRPSTSRLTIENPAYAFCSLGTWTPANPKKQASEITQATRRWPAPASDECRRTQSMAVGSDQAQVSQRPSFPPRV